MDALKSSHSPILDNTLNSLCAIFLYSSTGVKKQKAIPSSISVPVPASVLKEEGGAAKGTNMTPGKKKKFDDGNGGDRKKKHKVDKE